MRQRHSSLFPNIAPLSKRWLGVPGSLLSWPPGEALLIGGPPHLLYELSWISSWLSDHPHQIDNPLIVHIMINAVQVHQGVEL